jgi:hypothetical protein
MAIVIRGVQLFDPSVADLPRHNLLAQEYNFFSIIVYEIAVALTQVSICLFYLRLFGTSRPARVALKSTIVAVLFHFIPAESLWVFHCSPISGYWESDALAVCFSPKVGFYLHATASVSIDLWLIAFVVPRIWALKMARKQKVTLVFLVNTGWLVVVASIMRSYSVSQIVEDSDIACKLEVFRASYIAEDTCFPGFFSCLLYRPHSSQFLVTNRTQGQISTLPSGPPSRYVPQSSVLPPRP